MEARQRVKLTGTNRSFDLIALVAKARAREKARQTAEDRRHRTDRPAVAPLPKPATTKPVLLLSDDRPQTTEDGRLVLFPSSVVRPPSSEPFFAGLVALARRSDPIPSRTRPSNALAPMVLCLKTWESRSSPGLQRTENRRRRTDDRSAPPPSQPPSSSPDMSVSPTARPIRRDPRSIGRRPRSGRSVLRRPPSVLRSTRGGAAR